MSVLELVVHGERTNAGLAWASLVITAAVGAWEVLAGTTAWGLVGLGLVVVAALPALASGDWRVVVPWPLTACGAAAGLFWTYKVVPEVAGSLAVVTVALVVTVELDVFTPVELSRRFVVVFAVLSTLAVQALWTVVQFYSDRWFGSDLLGSQIELQWDIVAVTTTALVMGTVFVWYFERFSTVGDRRPLTPEEAP